MEIIVTLAVVGLVLAVWLLALIIRKDQELEAARARIEKLERREAADAVATVEAFFQFEAELVSLCALTGLGEDEIRRGFASWFPSYGGSWPQAMAYLKDLATERRLMPWDRDRRAGEDTLPVQEYLHRPDQLRMKNE